MDAVHSTRTLQACKPVLPVRPFAALPHDVASTPGLTHADLAVLVALTFWARDKDHCWPSDARIGQRIGRSLSTVGRRLRHLEALGLVERIKTDANRTGRLIRLVWRRSDDRPPRSPVTDPPRARMTDEGKRSVKGESPNPETAEIDQRPRPEPAPEPTPVKAVAKAEPAAPAPVAKADPPVPTTIRHAPQVQAPAVEPAPRSPAAAAVAAKAQTTAWAASDDPILRAEAERRLRPKAPPKPAPTTTAELLARLREDPSFVPTAAELLCREFDDRKSWNGYHAVVKRAWEGSIDPAVLVDALERAGRPDVRNRGAVFMTIVNREKGPRDESRRQPG